MPNRECNLTKRVRTDQGLRFCSVVLSANGRVKPDWVIVNGKEERHVEGAYYIEWRDGSKRIRVSVGKDASNANARRLRKEAELNAVNNGVSVVDEGPDLKRRLIASAVTEYLDEIKITRSEATHSAYELALRNFTESCPKTYLADLKRQEREQDARTQREQAARQVLRTQEVAKQRSERADKSRWLMLANSQLKSGVEIDSPEWVSFERWQRWSPEFQADILRRVAAIEKKAS